MSHADPSLSPLMALLGQAERERDDAVAQAQRAEAQLAAAQGQGEQLLAYRQDYEARFRDRFSRQGGIDTFQTYQGFMGRLSLAVDQQQGVVAQAARRADAARQVVREHELRVASVRKLIERRLTELRMAADRRDQKQTDEFASRAAWNRLAAEQAAPTV
jgi:flagellar FliJ protein